MESGNNLEAQPDFQVDFFRSKPQSETNLSVGLRGHF